VSMGATTILERCDGVFPDGRINSGKWTSLSRYAPCVVAERLQGGLGSQPAEPVWMMIRMRSVPGTTLTWVWSGARRPSRTVHCTWSLIHQEVGRLRFYMGLVVLPSSLEEVTLPSEVRKRG